MNFRIGDLKFDEHGLAPAIVQHARTREVLTLAYMNRESLERTIETKESWFWSRSRNELWHKGETSGHTQRVVEIILDCDKDAIILLVEPTGPACHTGERTCFHNAMESGVESFKPEVDSSKGETLAYTEGTTGTLGALLSQLYDLIESRKRERPAGSYTTYLFDEGLDKILKKVGEESAETIIAAKNPEPEALIAEVSDLVYHLLVLLVQRDLSLDQIRQELANRRNMQTGDGRE